MDTTATVFVANPGTLPEMRELACGLARRGILGLYTSPFDRAPTEVGRPRLLPSRLSRPLEAQLERRELCADVDSDRVAHAATALEVATILARRTGSRALSTRALQVRNVAFDRAAARQLDRRPRAVVAAYTSAVRTLRKGRERNMATLLNYPIAHHAFAVSILGEEARRRPDYAHTLQYHRFPRSLTRQMDEEIELADRVLVLSSFQKRTFVESGVAEDKLVVTPLGVDTEMFSPLPDHGPADRPFRIMFSGQIGQRKGIAYLVDAFRDARIPGSELVLVGTAVGTRAPWRTVPNVRHIQHVPRSQLPAIYQSADVFVFPSLVEGFGLTALEAMACGLPVIVSANTFAEDVIEDGHNGFIVPIRDATSIVERLRHLAEDGDARRAMGLNARRTAERFTWREYQRRAAEHVAIAAGL